VFLTLLHYVCPQAWVSDVQHRVHAIFVRVRFFGLFLRFCGKAHAVLEAIIPPLYFFLGGESDRPFCGRGWVIDHCFSLELNQTVYYLISIHISNNIDKYYKLCNNVIYLVYVIVFSSCSLSSEFY